jgi:oligopeptide/dipeptide ABC transporter ATP-binding protein
MQPIPMRNTAPMQDEAALLSVEDLRIHFEDVEGTVRAVDGASFEVARGRTLGIVGESGCGKSVTARAILRIEDRRSRIVAGRILLRSGSTVQDLVQLQPNSPAMRAIRGREIGLVFQEPMTSFSPVHTIGDQITETLEAHCSMSHAEARQRAIEQLCAVGAPHPRFIMSQYAWQLSGGLRQRAMIAMALMCDPTLLIADEPTTALDVTTQAQVLELLRALQRQRQMALILITHDLGVIAETADDVAIMYLGRVVERGPVEAIFSDPQHPYTQALLRSMPNVKARPRTRLTTVHGAVPHPLRRPRGCPFHPRCPHAMAGVCDQIEPVEIATSTHHVVSCHLHDEARLAGVAPASSEQSHAQ